MWGPGAWVSATEGRQLEARREAWGRLLASDGCKTGSGALACNMRMIARKMGAKMGGLAV